jgi:hypothetical protein
MKNGLHQLYVFVLRLLSVLIYFIGTPQCANGGGGIWVAEVLYDHNGISQTGYIIADIWLEDDRDLLKNDSLFDAEFRSGYSPSDTVVIYHQLYNREQLAERALFPMHPFMLNKDSLALICLSEIRSISLTRVWKRNDYVVRVLSDISLSDTTWISDSTLLEPVRYPAGDDAGCRLEVYDFNPSFDPARDLNELSLLYSPDTTVSENGNEKFQRIIDRLRKKKIVVIELCGC